MREVNSSYSMEAKAKIGRRYFGSTKLRHQTRSSHGILQYQIDVSEITANNRIKGLVSNDHIPWNESIETRIAKGERYSPKHAFIKVGDGRRIRFLVSNLDCKIKARGEISRFIEITGNLETRIAEN